MGRKRLASRYRVNRVKSKTKGWRYRVLCRDTGDHMGTWDTHADAALAAYNFDRADKGLRPTFELKTTV